MISNTVVPQTTIVSVIRSFGNQSCRDGTRRRGFVGRRVNWKVYRVDPRARTLGSSNPRVLEPRSRYEEVRPSSEPVVTVPTRDVVNAAREQIHLRAEGVTASRRS